MREEAWRSEALDRLTKAGEDFKAAIEFILLYELISREELAREIASLLWDVAQQLLALPPPNGG